MKVIEFLGPSGVGKSFLYQKLFSEESPGRPYRNLSQAYTIAAISAPSTLNNFLYKVLLASPFLRKRRLGISRTILALLEHSVEIPSGQFKTSLTILQDYLQAEREPRVVKKRISEFYKRIKQFYLLKQFLPEDEVVVFDEGLLHYHHGLSPELAEQFSLDTLHQDIVLSPKAVISCELPAAEVFKRAINRRSQGVKTFSHASLSEAELFEYVKKNVEEYAGKIKFLEKCGIPVLKIDTAESSAVNLASIDRFIRKEVKI